MKFISSPTEVVYDKMVRQWKELSRLFSVNDQRGTPKLAILRGTNVSLNKLKESLQFYPENPSEEYLSESINFIKKVFLFFPEDSSFYHHKNHFIFINNPDTIDLNLTLAEEVTHAVTWKECPIKTPLEDLLLYNGRYPGFGKFAYDTVKSFEIKEFTQSINEFFPPLGTAYLVGETKFNWEKAFKSIKTHWYTRKKTWTDKKTQANALLIYLPSLAGEILVKKYNYDVPSLLRDHPQLPHLDSKELWEQYCKPLLCNGKL